MKRCGNIENNGNYLNEICHRKSPVNEISNAN